MRQKSCKNMFIVKYHPMMKKKKKKKIYNEQNKVLQ